MEMQRDKSKRFIAIYVLYFAAFVLHPAIYGCGSTADPQKMKASADSKGYILYTFAKGTEVMIDLCKSDGISKGTKLDVFRMDVPNMREPVKLGEITIEKVDDKMSKAKITAVTSSLRMEQGDRAFPHLITIISDDSWLVSRKPVEGWKSDSALSAKRDWEPCEVLPNRGMEPELKQLVADTDAKAVWHPSVKSRRRDAYFRRVFRIDAEPMSAQLILTCGGKANIYINDRWVAEAEKWPEVSEYKVHKYLKRGRNLIAVQVTGDPRGSAPSVLYLALTVQTKFK